MKSDGLIPRHIFFHKVPLIAMHQRGTSVYMTCRYHALSCSRSQFLSSPITSIIRGQVTMNIRRGLVPCIKFLGTEISSNDFQNCLLIKLRTYELSSVTPLRNMYVCLPTDITSQSQLQLFKCLPTIKKFAILTELPAICKGPKVRGTYRKS